MRTSLILEPTHLTVPVVDDPVSSDVVVRVDSQSVADVRATLAAVSTVVSVQAMIVVDLSGRPEIAGVATEFGALYAATDPADRNGLRVMTMIVRTAQFGLLDAGDLPGSDFVALLAARLAAPEVAIVQAGSRRGGRGVARAAVWTGSGSLVRTEVLRGIVVGMDPARAAHPAAGVSVLAMGGRISTMRRAQVLQPASSVRARGSRLAAMSRVLFGRHGVLRSRTLGFAERAGVLSRSLRPA